MQHQTYYLSTLSKKLILEFIFIVFKMLQMSANGQKSCRFWPQSVKKSLLLGGDTMFIIWLLHILLSLFATYFILLSRNLMQQNLHKSLSIVLNTSYGA